MNRDPSPPADTKLILAPYSPPYNSHKQKGRLNDRALQFDTAARFDLVAFRSQKELQKVVVIAKQKKA